MLYKVEAKFYKDKLPAFFKALNDGSIENQKPDGSTMHKAIQEAIMIDSENLAWYEVCYCATPLKHERETVYDRYLYEMQTTLVDAVKDDLHGASFWEYMEKM